MKGKKEVAPHGSELQAEDWLASVASNVRFVGDGEGPPDFVVLFDGKEVAVEVTRMLDGEGWPPEQRIAFERNLEAVIQSLKDEPCTPRWHVRCEYDPEEPRPPKPNGKWVGEVRDALRKPGPGGQLQLIPRTARVGRGIRVKYMPAGNNGGFSGVEEDIGIWPGGTASTRIAACVTEKARKVQNGRRAQEYARWWLVLVEEVVHSHAWLGEEWSNVKDSIQSCGGLDQWNKVVVLSRRTGEYTAVYERPGDQLLL